MILIVDKTGKQLHYEAQPKLSDHNIEYLTKIAKVMCNMTSADTCEIIGQQVFSNLYINSIRVNSEGWHTLGMDNLTFSAGENIFNIKELTKS